MDLRVDAPIASAEIDYFSEGTGSVRSLSHLSSQHPAHESTPRSLFADYMGLDVLYSGSLSDLVLNFDQKIEKCLGNSLECEDLVFSGRNIHERQAHEVSLNEVKFWWRETVEDWNTNAPSYPFGESNPGIVGTYDEFELVDADGITENDPMDIHSHKSDKSRTSQSPSLSHQSHMTTESDSSTTASPSTLTKISTSRDAFPDPLIQFDWLSDAWISDPVGLVQEISHMSNPQLHLCVNQLNTEVMQLSEQLVELLATRDELIMTREASDDFILLLDLLHQRRSRASQAALKLTARSRIRPKSFIGLDFARFARHLFPSHASSLSSVNNNSSHEFSPVTNKCTPTQNGTTSILTGGEDQWNLRSKHRRPRTVHIGGRSDYVSANLHRQPYSTSPAARSSVSSMDGEVGNYPLGGGQLKNGAQLRLNHLQQLSITLPWPDGHPRLSQSLSLGLPYLTMSTQPGPNLPTLRLLNHILHGTLLEKRTTIKLIDMYVRSVNEQIRVAKWVENTKLECVDGN